MLENFNQRSSKRGIFAVEERRNNLNYLFAYIKKLRTNGEIDIPQKKLYAEMAIKLGVTQRKFKEYLDIMEAKEYVSIIDEDVILKKELDNAV